MKPKSFLNKLKSIFLVIQFDNKTEKKDLNLYYLYYFWPTEKKIIMIKTKYRSFSKARDFALKLGLKNRYEWVIYCSIDNLKPSDIPNNPDEIYKAWNGWKNWLGNYEKVPFLPFEEARKKVREKNLKNTAEWKKWCDWTLNGLGIKPPNIPASPHIYYKNSGWAGYNDWLGTENTKINREYRSFEEARKFARSLGLTSSEYWLRYCKGEISQLPDKPEDIPTNVARKYRDIGWNGMNDFLNAKEHRRIKRLTNARDFNEARAFVHQLKIKNLKEWLKYVKGELTGYSPKPADIPNSPELVYKGHGWKGYGDWFGTYAIAPFKRKYRSFESARDFARELGLTSSEKWIEYCKGNLPHLVIKPEDIPTNVARKYAKEGWKGYKDFLQSNLHRQKYSKFLPYEEARNFIHSLKLKDYKEWHKYICGELSELPKKPKNIPSNPSGVYKDKGWIGIGDWIGSEAFPYAHLEYIKFTDARKFARELGLTSSVEWVAYCKGEFKHLPTKPHNLPANVVRKYEGKGWKGFKDFLWSDRHRKARKLFMSYSDAKALVSNKNINSEKKLFEFIGSIKKPNNFPEHPQMTYQRKGWESLEEFLA